MVRILLGVVAALSCLGRGSGAAKRQKLGYRELFGSKEVLSVLADYVTQAHGPGNVFRLLRKVGDTVPHSAMRADSGVNVLMMAAAADDFELMRVALDHAGESGAVDIAATDRSGRTVLHFAAAAGGASLRAILSSYEARQLDVDKQDDAGLTALMIASEKGHKDAVRMLLSNGADPNIEDQIGRPALFFAASFGRSECISMLLRSGATSDPTSPQGITPLFLAASRCFTESVKVLLLSSGSHRAAANPHHAIKDGTTPLIAASERGCLEIVKRLLQDGSDARKTRNDGVSALHLAAQNGHLQVAKLLIPETDVNLADHNGITPLMLASEQGQHAIVVALVQVGKANVSLKTHRGVTALQLAEDNRHERVANLLRSLLGIDSTSAEEKGKAKQAGAKPADVPTEGEGVRGEDASRSRDAAKAGRKDKPEGKTSKAKGRPPSPTTKEPRRNSADRVSETPSSSERNPVPARRRQAEPRPQRLAAARKKINSSNNVSTKSETCKTSTPGIPELKSPARNPGTHESQEFRNSEECRKARYEKCIHTRHGKCRRCDG
eukprot:scaffold83_cov246-Pinguiococcus_pyrenoidosus.AAC.13